MTTKPKRLWYQFSLRTLLISVLVLSLPLSWVACRIQKARKQRAAVDAIVTAGGEVYYDYQMDGYQGYGPFTASSIPKWARTALGDDFFFDVTSVHLAGDCGDNEATLLDALTSLAELYVRESKVTDTALEHLEGLANLECLDLSNTQITDAGLEHLKGLSKLGGLFLDNTHVTDAGVDHLERLTTLEYLSLGNTKITNAGLEHLNRLTRLTFLDLPFTEVTDAGLKHLEGLTHLEMLDLRNTQVTPEGVKNLPEALPNCEIDY